MSNKLAGRAFIYVFGELRMRYSFVSETTANILIEQGGGMAVDGNLEQVEITLEQLRPGVYLNSWTEKSGVTVSQVIDLDEGRVYSDATVNGTLYRLRGTVAEV